MSGPQYPPAPYGPQAQQWHAQQWEAQQWEAQPTQQFAVPPAGGWGAPPQQWPQARTVNVAGLVTVVAGGALTMIGAFADWYTDTRLGDIVNALDAVDDKPFPQAYLGWLLWVVLAASGVAGLFASLPSGAATALRLIGPILAVVGGVLVVVALNDLVRSGSVFDHSEAGLYLTIGGFLVVAVGGVLGPRRARPGPYG